MLMHAAASMVVLTGVCVAFAADGEGELAAVGDSVVLAGRTVTVTALEVTPVIRNEFSKRFTFDVHGDAAHAKLRRQEKLDEVVARGKTEFERQVLLMDWTYRRFKRFNAPSKSVRTPLEILEAIDEGHTFNCGYFAQVLYSALSSFGYPTRHIGLKGAKSDGNGTGHAILEVWSNEHRKWVVLDPTLNLYFEIDGVPANAYEIRQDWFYNEGAKLALVIGPERKRHTVKDLPIHRAHHPGFGNLQINDRSLGKFLYVAYTPLTASGGFDYGQMFITKDALSESVAWHTRICPAEPATEPYWPLNQAALTLTPADGPAVRVAIETDTPDFAGYRYRVDGGDWRDGEPGVWRLREGGNTLEVVVVNRFGVTGPPGVAVLHVK